MQYGFRLTETCATLCDKNLREYISPTLNTNTFLLIKDSLSVINKHSMNAYSHMLFFTHHFALKKKFKDLSVMNLV